MNHLQRFLCRPGHLLLGCLILAGASSSPADSEPAPGEPLRVYLRGASTAELAELVASTGGEVTHRLPLLNAVGARMQRRQLDAIADHASIERIIDDLGMPPADEEDGPACDVGGQIYLERTSDGVAWTLHRLADPPIRLSAVDLEWPESWGGIRELTLAGRPLLADLRREAPPGAESTGPGRLSHSFDPEPLFPEAARAQLAVAFERPPAPSENLAAAIHIRLTVTGGCKAETAREYPDNADDSYFPRVSGLDLLHRNGIKGDGVTVAVLDSGLWEKPDGIALDTRGNNRILARYDAIADKDVPEAFDESGHGTHMTSIVARSDPAGDGEDSGAWKGAAPDARLVVVKAFDTAGNGDLLDIVRGIQWVVEHAEEHAIRVLNLSFSARPRWPYWADPINQAAMRAWAAGIVVVAAAGNDGPELMSIGSPGNTPHIITVGAVTDDWTPDTRVDDYLPDFSSRGPTPLGHVKPDVVTLGGHMTGLTRPGSSLSRQFPHYFLAGGDFVMTGTSQAAALVSGMVALLLQLEPELAPDDVKCLLTSSAEPAINDDGTMAYSPFEQGSGLVSVQRAIVLGDRSCEAPGRHLQRELETRSYLEGPAIFETGADPTLPGMEYWFHGSRGREHGFSASRRWGVKAHMERDAEPPGALTTSDRELADDRSSATEAVRVPTADGVPDWPAIYERERRLHRQLSEAPAD